MSITSSAVLVEMSISVWTANKTDKAATNKVLADNLAQASDAAQVRKNLMAGTGLRKEIADYAAQCRLWHNTRTLPWADRGARLLPTSLFLDYKQEANKRRDMFKAMVDNFIDKYPALVQTAHNYLGSLFDSADYPDADEVANKFGYRLVFSPVPDAGDFRLDIAAQDMAELRDQYDTQFNDRIADAVRKPWNDLHKMLVGMSEKLTEEVSDDPENPVPKKRLWHDTFITNAQEMCALLTHFNLTKDPQMEEARRQLERTLVGADIDVIKGSPLARSEMKGKVDAMLKQFEW